jgi:hypothetical protein
MHDIEPYFGWNHLYESVTDRESPFYGKEHSLFEFTDAIYGYYIHPQWDYIGSETLFIKILFADYDKGFLVIELIGEWNDTLHNDVMHLKRNIIDFYLKKGITKFLLIGEHIYNFHGSDDCYYEEWFEDVEDGWVVGIGFHEHVVEQWSQYGIDFYLNFGGSLERIDWRTFSPKKLYLLLNDTISRRIALH